ncbi:hypothetical protein, partial [Pseudomonas syringae]|uniref:hypothetical protein n=1 Tax=Pseudomonas syringae TaxID=317 RepID=UPI0011457B0F
MNDQMMAELFAQIGFKVDLKGIQQAKGALKHLEQQAKATGKAMQQSMKQSAGGGSPKAITAATQAQTKAQFAAQLQGAKLTALNNKSAASGLQTQQQQVKLQIQQQKLAAQTAVSQAQAARDAPINLLRSGGESQFARHPALFAENGLMQRALR